MFVCGLAAAAGGQGRTVLDGVYSEAQAEHGAEEYDTHCAHCHEGSEPDAPSPMNPSFIDRWREAPLDFLFTHIRTNMPGDQPGSLGEDAYLSVLAHILRENGYPAGPRDLATQDLGGILLVGPDGPRPLPANAMVRVVGCLAESADGWSLGSASAPVRVRNGDRTTPDELALSAAAAAGAASYRLRHAAEHRPEAVSGKRVQVKGVLTAQGSASTVSVLSLASVGAGCP